MKFNLKINKIFKNTTNTQITNETKNSIENILLNNKDKIDIYEKSGVYKIKCPICNKIYIGKTTRTLNIRLKEHLKQNTSMVYKHITETGHQIKKENMSLLIELQKSNLLDYTEKYFIFKHLKEGFELLNENIDISSAPLFTINLKSDFKF